MTGRRPIHVGVYADVDLNYIDGSSIWLQSLCSVLSHIPETRVDLVAKAPIHRDLLVKDLLGLENLTFVEADKRRSPEDAHRVLRQVDDSDPMDSIIVRGRAACLRMAQDDRLSGKLWSYLTDVPQTVPDLDSEAGRQLIEILQRSSRILCQTEWLRAWFSALSPDNDHKMLLLPPMVPPKAFREHSRPWRTGGLRLLYAGKFAPDWGILETVEQLENLTSDEDRIRLVVAGDKIHDPPDNPDFAPAVRAALDSDVVDWRGGIERAAVFDLLDEVDLALSVRSHALNDSRELSTKLLEYSAAGVPVVANRTLPHVELFGHDYPLLVESFEQIGQAVRSLGDDPAEFHSLSQWVRSIAEPYSYPNIATALDRYLQLTPPPREAATTGRRILVAGHDFKFISGLIKDWRTGGAVVVTDEWSGHSSHDETKSHRLAADSDLILCEWMLGNAVFFSENRPDDTPLLVRMHRMELETDWPRAVDSDHIDTIIFVSEHTKREAILRFDLKSARTTVIPNGIDEASLDRPKLPNAQFTLGMIGFLPRLKRIDRALDLLAALRAEDARFRLVARGDFPHQVSWVWNNLEERSYFESQMSRIEDEPLLKGAVHLEGRGPDIPSWLRQVGYILSPSDVESFHLALIEGMASGAAPVVWSRKGADEIVAPHWVHRSTEEAAAWVLATRDDLEESGRKAQSEVTSRYSLPLIRDRWAELMEDALLRTHEGPSYENLSPASASQFSYDATAIVQDLCDLHPFRYVRGAPTPADEARATELLSGRFSPSPLFDPISRDLPPDWTENPFDNRSWDFHRHSLEWLEPLIRVAVAGRDEALQAVVRTVADWIENCSRAAGPTHSTWNDRTVAIRTRLLLFFLQALGDRLTDQFAERVLASLTQHGEFLADDRFYLSKSNYALEVDSSLLVLASALRGHPLRSHWETVGTTRLDRWLKSNFSRLGIHLEQSPAYHLFVGIRLLSLMSYFRRNQLPMPPRLEAIATKAMAVWPFFRRPDGSVPMIGDTPQHPRPTDWTDVFQSLLDQPPRSVAPETLLNPRSDQDSFFLDGEAGYAIFADQKPSTFHHGGWSNSLHFHLTFKCNAFFSQHCHRDMGSLVLWVDGQEWIVDPGYYSMDEKTPETIYMRSSRAHSVVLLDGEDFDFGNSRVIDYGRTQECDFVTVEHHLSGGLHTRTVEVRPADRLVRIQDRVSMTDRHPHGVTQQFHLHPRLEIAHIGDGEVELRDGSDTRIIISQSFPVQTNEMSGDVDGQPSGWYSSRYLQREPSTILQFSTLERVDEARFLTHLRVVDS